MCHVKIQPKHVSDAHHAKDVVLCNNVISWFPSKTKSVTQLHTNVDSGYALSLTANIKKLYLKTTGQMGLTCQNLPQVYY